MQSIQICSDQSEKLWLGSSTYMWKRLQEGRFSSHQYQNYTQKVEWSQSFRLEQKALLSEFKFHCQLCCTMFSMRPRAKNFTDFNLVIQLSIHGKEGKKYSLLTAKDHFIFQKTLAVAQCYPESFISSMSRNNLLQCLIISLS